jgi:serine/threonine protein kinase
MIEELRASDPAQIGRYRLIGRLGDGGMGQVYLARSPGGRKVAVKVIRAELAQDEDFRARFSREAEAAKRVGGIFTAPVVDADPDCERPWLATAYVEGQSLAEAVRDQGPMDTEAVLRLAAGLTEGLAAIHAAGVIHRDLKPSNVMLAADGPRIIDFGISRPMDAGDLTSTGNILGSPGFMSPEQAEGLVPIGPPTDIFSLGAILTFAATGDGPFGTGRDTVLLYRVIYTAPNLAKVPVPLRSLIERCLAMDPAQRPTPEEILTELYEQTQPVRSADFSPQNELPPLAQSGLGHPQAGPVSSQPETNARAKVFGGPVQIDSRGYPVHLNQSVSTPPPPAQPTPPAPVVSATPPAPPAPFTPQSPPPYPLPLPLLVAAEQSRPQPKRRGWLAYYVVAAVLIVVAAVVIAVHLAGQSSALPDNVPTTGPSASVSVTTPAAGDPAAVVRAYYQAIKNDDFAKAWKLGGKNLGQTFTAFAAGLAEDANVTVMNLTTAGDTVTAKIKTTAIDGTTEVLNLTYKVVNGVITQVTGGAS